MVHVAHSQGFRNQSNPKDVVCSAMYHNITLRGREASTRTRGKRVAVYILTAAAYFMNSLCSEV